MERAICSSSAMPVTPQKRTMGRAGRYEGELDARKRARPVRWRGKALSSLDDMLIPLSFKWSRKCAYCGKEHVPLQIEHILSRARGGTDRTSNLTLSCEQCNIAKGTQDIRAFLKDKPDVLKRLLAQAKAPLKDAAAVNAARWELYHRLERLGLPVECGTGGRTKYNRSRQGLEKAHWIDAVCVGASTPATLQVNGFVPLLITANGHGNRQRCGTDMHGFPRRHRSAHKRFFGFQTGDMVRATVQKGKNAGIHVGRVLVRATGSFDIRTQRGRVQGISHRSCTPLHRSDGYSYQQGEGGNFSPRLARRGEIAAFL